MGKHKLSLISKGLEMNKPVHSQDLTDELNKGLEKHNDSDKLKILSVSENSEEDTVTISAILTT